MGANKYDVVPEYEYMPRPLDLLLKAGMASQDKFDKALATLQDTGNKLVVQGGPRTMDRAKQFNEQVIQPKLQEYSQQLLNGESPNKVYYGLGNFANQVKQNSEYQDITQDFAYRDTANKLVADQAFPNVVQSFYDMNNKSFNQTKQGERFDARNFYGTVAPGDPQKEFKPFYEQIKPMIFRNYDPATTETYTDDKGNVHLYNIRTGERIESVTADRVWKAAYDLSQNDPNFPALQSFNYAQAIHGQQYPGSKLGHDDYADIFTKNFLGAYRRSEETQPMVKSVGETKEGTKTEGDITNPIVNLLGQLNDKGVGTANGEVVSAIAGGGKYDPKENSFKLPVSGDDTFFHISTNELGNLAPNLQTAQTISKAAGFLGSLNALKDQLTPDSDALKEASIEILKKKYPSDKFEVVDSPYDMRYGNVYKKNSSGVVLEEVSRVADVYDEAKDLALQPILQQSPEYQTLVQNAKKYGVDLTNSDLKSEIEGISKRSPKLKAMLEFSTAVHGMAGDFEFVPNRTENTFVGDDGNHYINGKIQVPESYFENNDKFDGWKKLKDLGIINYVKQSKTANGDGTENIYELPITKLVDGDYYQMTDKYYNQTAGTDLKTMMQVPQKIKEVKQFIDENITSRKEAEEVFNNPQVIGGIVQEMNKNLDLLAPEFANEANTRYTEIMNLPEDTKEQKIQKLMSLKKLNDLIKSEVE